MCIKGSETVAMVNDDIITKSIMVSGGNHCAARGSHYGDNAASGGDVDAFVFPSVTDGGAAAVSYTHLTLPTTPYV